MQLIVREPIDIREISPQDTWQLRHEVMWPEKPISYVQLEEDEQGLHFGVFDGTRIVSGDLFIYRWRRCAVQKICDACRYAGKGYGTALLQYLVNEARTYAIRRLWCNARTSKSFFYERAGFYKTDKTFEKDGMDYVVMEQLLM